MRIYVPKRTVEEWILEDLWYDDTTTSSLGISEDFGEAMIITREEALVACTEEAAMVYEELGAEVKEYVPTGRLVGKNSKILVARGKAGALHAAWRVAQTIIAFASGVATYAMKMLSEARSVNPRIILAATRKAPPGAKRLYFKAVLAAGFKMHRYGLTGSLLLFKNHLAFYNTGLSDAVKRLAEKNPDVMVGVEVESLEEAIEAVKAGAGYIQIEKPSVNDAGRIISEVKRINPRVKIGLAGGITLENVKEYASTGADFIVTSAPYSAKPIDVTTRMRRI